MTQLCAGVFMCVIDLTSPLSLWTTLCPVLSLSGPDEHMPVYTQLGKDRCTTYTYTHTHTNTHTYTNTHTSVGEDKG